MIDTFVNNYESNPTRYLRGISEHAVTMYKAICKNNGVVCNIDFDEDMFYINEQMKENGLSIREYTGRTGKKHLRKTIGTRMNYEINTKNYYLISPATFANLYYTEALNDIDMPARYKHAVFDYDLKNKLITAIAVTDDVFTYYDKVPLTSEENTKLTNARNEYNNAIKKFNTVGLESEDIFTTKPQTEDASSLTAGNLKDSMKAGINSYYNSIRAGAGLATVKQSSQAYTRAQYMAVLQSYRFHGCGLPIAHNPAKPDGVSDSFYKTAIGYGQVSMAENIAMHREAIPTPSQMMRFVNQFMDDSSETPYQLGHRTSLLIPSNDTLGFGIAKSIGVMEIEHNQDNAKGINVVAWPSEGVTFMEHLDIDYFNWSTKFYNTLSVNKNTSVKVKCLTTGETWNFTQPGNTADYFFRRDCTGAIEIKDKVIFGDSTLIPQAGFVYEITVSNLTDNSTGAANASYTYRSVFEYADTSKYPTSATAIKIDRSNLKKVGTAEKYYAPVDKDFKVTATVEKNITDIKLTWSVSDDNVKITQNGILDIPDNYPNGKEIVVTVKSDASNVSDSVTLVTYKSKDTIHFDQEELSLKIGDTNSKSVTVTSVDNGNIENIEWKIAYDSMPDTYLDITDEKITEFFDVNINGSTLNIKANSASKFGSKLRIYAIIDNDNGTFEGNLPVTVTADVDGMRMEFAYRDNGINQVGLSITSGIDNYTIIDYDDIVSRTGNPPILMLKATVYPENVEMDRTIDWSIVEDEDGVLSKYDDNGKFIINKGGKAIIKLTHRLSGFSKEYTVTVTTNLESLSISGSSKDIIYDQDNPTDILTINRTPVYDGTELIYTSSDESIAEVTQKGMVVFQGNPGEVTITATSSKDSSITSSYTYNVTIDGLQGLTISGTAENFLYDENHTQDSLNITRNPINDDTPLKFSSSNGEIATVDSNGNVYFTGVEGSVTITAESSKNKAIKSSYTYNVKSLVLKKLRISGTRKNIKISDTNFTDQLQITKTPVDSTTKIKYTSSDENRATVDENGLVTFNYYAGDGNVTITATSTLDDSVTASYTYLALPLVQKLELEESTITLLVGSTVQTPIITYPRNQTYEKYINYYNTNSDIANVDKNTREITALKAGKTTVTASLSSSYTLDNKYTYVKFNINVVDVMKGDINKDGKVTLYDAFTMLRMVITENDFTEEQIYVMDFNNDEKVTLFDAFSWLRQAILN